MYQRVKVLDINIVQKTGIYSPMTSRGHLLVDRIHASCHSETDNYSLQNTFFTVSRVPYFTVNFKLLLQNVLRWKSQIRNYFWTVEDSTNEDNIGYGLNGVMAVLDIVIPSKLM